MSVLGLHMHSTYACTYVHTLVHMSIYPHACRVKGKNVTLWYNLCPAYPRVTLAPPPKKILKITTFSFYGKPGSIRAQPAEQRKTKLNPSVAVGKLLPSDQAQHSQLRLS